MSDTITSIFEGGRKRGEGGGEFFSAAEVTDQRVDFRWPQGWRCALPYIHLHEVRYTEASDGGTEEIFLHFPGFSAVRIIGRQLLSLYDGLIAHRVSWVRQRGEAEDIPGSALCVERIDYFPLTDWEVDHAAMEGRKAALLEAPAS